MFENNTEGRIKKGLSGFPAISWVAVKKRVSAGDKKFYGTTSPAWKLKGMPNSKTPDRERIRAVLMLSPNQSDRFNPTNIICFTLPGEICISLNIFNVTE
ncbi:hypothetical protein JW964_27410 [candidate division KSB1 bacterium]|nr:hypothetical protein [candidate division KSB1 bacterium]